MTLPPHFLLPLSPSYVLLLPLSPSPVFLVLKPWSGFWNTGKAPNATTISNAYFALTHNIIGQISLRYEKEKNCLCQTYRRFFLVIT